MHFYPRSPCGERPREREPALSQSSISIHALLAESDIICQRIGIRVDNFYPRSPCGERHKTHRSASSLPSISIHALLAESDPGKVRVVEPGLVFLSTLSLRRATSLFCHCWNSFGISIHALLAESDVAKSLAQGRDILFLSTLSLRRATSPDGSSGRQEEFLSTLSLRRATKRLKLIWRYLTPFLSTLSLRRATWHLHCVFIFAGISIHALLAESDMRMMCPLLHVLPFLSTLSLRRATLALSALGGTTILISIHALLAESDRKWPKHRTQTQNFYPRSPCGERHAINGCNSDFEGFLSTLSLRRAT